jgi:hypothetical protein
MVKGAIEHYSKKWFEFPYPAATMWPGIVEWYGIPGIVFCGLYFCRRPVYGELPIMSLGHTWFPMIVGSNERKYAWMDEALIHLLTVSRLKNSIKVNLPPPQFFLAI